MRTVTMHVFPANGHWMVQKSGQSPKGQYSSQKEATAAAKKLVKATSIGQVVVHTRNGKMIVAETHGLPKVQRTPFKSKIGKRLIERAVSTVIRTRLAGA